MTSFAQAIHQSVHGQRTLAVYQTLTPQQFSALAQANWRRVEPGRDGQHFCHLKLQQRYAEMIARQWAVPVHGEGYVVRLVFPARVLAGFDLETVAYEEHLEYRVPVCELPRLSRHLVGSAHLVSTFREQHSYSIPPGSRPLAGLIG